MKPDKNDPRWARLTGNQCFCSGCGEYFTTVGNFDKHKRIDGCLDPETVGLTRDDRGYWKGLPPDQPVYVQRNAQKPRKGAGMTNHTQAAFTVGFGVDPEVAA